MPTQLRSLDFSKIIPLEEYVDIQHAVPHRFLVGDDHRRISVFGADHSNDENHPQFRTLRKIFRSDTPHCVLLEGIQDELLFSHLHALISSMSTPETISRGGEAVYAAKLALEAGATWQSFEPTDTELFRFLEQFGFSRSEILAWAVLRLLPQYIRRNETVHFFQYLEPFLDQIVRSTGWYEALQPPRELLQAVTVVLGTDIHLHSERRAINYTSPLATLNRDHDYTILNTIAATATEYRDRAMLQNIVQASEAYESILVVCGASHAVRQESVLKAHFGE